MLHHSVTLLNNVSATGSGGPFSWPGGRGVLTASGTFTGSTMTIEYRNIDNAWVPVSTPAGSPVAMTAAGQAIFEAPVGNIRATLTSGTPSGITATAGTTSL